MSNAYEIDSSTTTIDSPPINPTQLNAYTIFTASVAAIAGILFGFDTGIISGAILFIDNEFSLTAQTNGLVVSSLLFGALVGAIFSGRLADTCGRRNILIVTAVIFVIGTTLSALAPTVSILIASRIVIGLAVGIASFTAPLYLSEISPARYRGALVSLNQLAITIGILLAYIINLSFASEGLWRHMFVTGVIPALLLLVGMLILPPSPRWLMLKGRRQQAEKILKRIRGTDNIHTEINEIQKSLEVEKGTWRLLFKPMLYPIVIIAFGLAVFQQITGINTIIYYAPTTFLLAGFESETTAILATMGVGVVNVLFTIVALFFIDRWGRRPLLLLGLTGMTIALSCVGFSFLQGGDSSILHWLTLGAMLLYIACFAFSLGPIMWLIIAEIFPLRIRGLGTSIAVGISWGANMIVAATFLSLIDSFTPGGTFLFFAGLSILSLIFVYYCVPETKGVSLEQIEANLHAGKSMRKLGEPS